eukprot:g1767.t1
MVSTRSEAKKTKAPTKAAPAGAGSAPRGHVEPNPITIFAAVTTYFSYAVLVIFGHIRDFFGFATKSSRYLGALPPPGFAPLLKSWENFYTRRMYHRIQDCWNRPISSSPGAYIEVVDRDSSDGNKTMAPVAAGTTTRCLNLGSYNYLGFADDWQESCRGDVMAALQRFNISCGSSLADAGTTSLHRELERAVARFVGKPDAMVFNMGFGTNASAIPSLVGKGCLIISDSLNHTSIVAGARASGAKIAVFRHNDTKHLERLLRRSIIDGQPGSGRAWRKILVMVEGIYSMEGEICNLKGVAEVTKRHNAYLYVDEAHSIGALGETGRGICEYCGVSPDDVDIMMGTFTKSFGAMGGYIAGSKAFVDHLRAETNGSLYGAAMSPVVCQQVITAFKIISGEDGTDLGARKLAAIRENSNLFRQGLIDLGLEVFGDWNSPIMPVMLYNPAKIPAFSRECLKRGLAVVVVGFPATPLVLSRARFCISAGHGRADLQAALKAIGEVADLLKIRYRAKTFG